MKYATLQEKLAHTLQLCKESFDECDREARARDACLLIRNYPVLLEEDAVHIVGTYYTAPYKIGRLDDAFVSVMDVSQLDATRVGWSINDRETYKLLVVDYEDMSDKKDLVRDRLRHGFYAAIPALTSKASVLVWTDEGIIRRDKVRKDYERESRNIRALSEEQRLTRAAYRIRRDSPYTYVYWTTRVLVPSFRWMDCEMNAERHMYQSARYMHREHRWLLPESFYPEPGTPEYAEYEDCARYVRQMTEAWKISENGDKRRADRLMRELEREAYPEITSETEKPTGFKRLLGWLLKKKGK